MFTILNLFREFQAFDQDTGMIFTRGKEAYPPINVYATGDMLTLKTEKKPVEQQKKIQIKSA